MKTARAGVICLLIASTACGSDDATGTDVVLDALPVTEATVVAAVQLMTALPLPVVASCAGNPTINCSGGVPGATISIPFTHTTPTATLVSPGVYSFGTDITINSAPGIPLTYTGVGCTVGVNTTAGSSQTVHLGGTATFSSYNDNGVTDELDITPELTGVEAADMTISGGTGCSLFTAFSGMFVNSFVSSFDQLAGQLCGAPGPTLLVPCSEVAATAKYGRNR